jgi:hypothetical protein
VAVSLIGQFWTVELAKLVPRVGAQVGRIIKLVAVAVVGCATASLVMIVAR